MEAVFVHETAEPAVAGAALLFRQQLGDPNVVGADQVAHQVVTRPGETEGAELEGSQRCGGGAGTQEGSAGGGVPGHHGRRLSEQALAVSQAQPAATARAASPITTRPARPARPPRLDAAHGRA